MPEVSVEARLAALESRTEALKCALLDLISWLQTDAPGPYSRKLFEDLLTLLLREFPETTPLGINETHSRVKKPLAS